MKKNNSFIVTSLVDNCTASLTYNKEILVRVSHSDSGIEICPEGYGNANDIDGNGVPVLIEYWDGKLRVHVWGDINREDPTHSIDLSGAKESQRKYCDKCGNLLQLHNGDGSCVKETA